MKVKSIHAAPALLIFVFALLAVSELIPQSAVDNQSPYLTLVLIQIAVFAVPALFFCLLRGGKYTSRLRVRPFRIAHLPLIIYAAVFAASGCYLISMLMYKVFPDQMAGSLITGYSDASGAGILFAVLTFAIVPAITEEFMFRSVILTEYEGSGIVTAVILSSLTFAMLHFNFVRLPAYFFCGIVLAIVTLATRSVLASMTVHAAVNVVIMLLEKYMTRLTQKQSGGLIVLEFIIAAAFFFFAFLTFGKAQRVYSGYAKSGRESELIPKRTDNVMPHFAEAVLSPTFLLLILFYIVITVIK